MSAKTNAWAALLLLTALNFLNYIDRNVLFAVQPLIQKEFALSDQQVGFLTSAFFVCYMIAAPLIVPLADRFPRRWIMAAGAFVWSLATLLSAVTNNYDELLLRHVIVGIGEATFVAISPAFLADLFPETMRGRVMGLFYLATPVGSALGYLVGGFLGDRYGWRAPFLVSALPGLLLAFGVLALREPARGASDHMADSFERGSLRGLFQQPGFLDHQPGSRHDDLRHRGSAGVDAYVPDPHPPRAAGARQSFLRCHDGNRGNGGHGAGWVAGRSPAAAHARGLSTHLSLGMTLSIPAIIAAIYCTGPAMYPAIFLGEFCLLLNTAPLNAALVNSVSARIRATALAVNIFTIHLLGDAFSPTLIGYISDKSNLQMGLMAMIAAVALSAAVLFYGMRFAPKLESEQLAISN